MPEGPDGKTIIIVKKVSGHGGHHGGAWKVAYADFVTAMMALFLVLWLVNSASVVTKQAIASYFRRPGVFELGSGTPLEIGGSGILADSFAPPADENAQVIAHSKIYESHGEGFKPTEDQKAGKSEQQAEFEEVQRELQSEIRRQGKALEGALGQVDVKVDQRGLHIEIMDTPTASMFQLGSAAMLPDAQQALLDIANIVHKLPNPIDIEGHTDAKPFRSAAITGYDNWNLSTDRANEARRILQRAGIEDEQIARVVGYANQRLKDPDDPFNPANRRISISMRYTEQAAAALVGTHFSETKSIPKQQIRETNSQTSSVAAVEEKPAEPAKADLGVTAEQGAEPVAGAVPDLSTGHTRVDEKSGLRVEVGTSLPEGAISQQADETPSRPVWMQKDKIFGDQNPFLDR